MGLAREAVALVAATDALTDRAEAYEALGDVLRRAKHHEAADGRDSPALHDGPARAIGSSGRSTTPARRPSPGAQDVSFKRE